MHADVSLIALTRFDPRHRTRATVPNGATIEQIVAAAAAGALPGMLRVTIGDQIIPPALWRRVRPKPGAVVIVRAIPRGDQNILRSVLLLAVTVAALAIGQLWLGPLVATQLGFAAGSFGASFITSATTSVLAIGGTLLVNALIPVKPPLADSAPSPTYSIQGWRNVANPDGPVPSVLGEHRMAPPYAAMPYTELDGDDQYVRAAFNFGYGPVSIRNLRVGDTPIEKYQGVSIEIRNGYPGDAPLTLYPQQVLEEALSITLSSAAGAISRYTANDASEVSIDIAFPGGLAANWSKNGKSKELPVTVTFAWRQRKVGTDIWQDLGTFDVTGQKQGKPLRRMFRWALPERGRYEIELRRVTDDYDDMDQSALVATFVSRSMWTALRSYRPEYPINFDQPLALAAVRIKASEQLNGTLDNFSADVAVLCKDWDGSDWIVRETQNPASLFRHVLQGPAITYPLMDEEIAALEEWHDFCRLRGLSYNRVHDYEASVLDVLMDVAAAGRASPHDTGTSWGVVIDRAMTLIEGHISPRNSWGFAGERVYAQRPDAFRVSFVDETNDFQKSERIVPFPDFVGSVKVTEALNIPGITDPAAIWKEARRRQYEVMHRPDTYTVSQDFEHIVHTRGALVRLSHDVLDRTQVSGRVKDVFGDVVVLDETVTMVEGESYCCRFRRADGQSLLRTVETQAGSTNGFTLTGSGGHPEPGDLAMFGQATRESFEAIVKSIEVSDNLTGRLTLIDHAPQIEELTEAEVAPPWDGRAGGEITPSDGTPPVPIILDILSGEQIGGGGNVVVKLHPGTGSITTTRYELRHRLIGSPTWAVLNFLAGEGGATLTAYQVADEIEVNARAISFGGTPSVYTVSETHTVAGADLVIPAIAGFTAVRNGTLWQYDWEFAPIPPGRTAADLSGVQIRYRLGLWSSFSDLVPLHTGYLTAAPWSVNAPATGEIYTFGIAAISVDGDLGPTSLIVAGAWRNLLEHSDDPQGWPGTATGVTFGAAVSDPEGGSHGRSVGFGSNAGRIEAEALVSGDLDGRTFAGSLHLRAPAGKSKIMVLLETESVSEPLEVVLTSSWQRVDLSLTAGVSDTTLTLVISNEASSGLSNTAAGTVEIFGCQPEEAASPSAYQRRP